MDCLLSTIEPFKTLPAEVVSELAAGSLEFDLPAEHVLFRQGDPADFLYIVLDGTVSVYNESEDGREWQRRILERGEVFGEMAVLTGRPRSASVRTATASRLMLIRKPEFDRVVESHPELVVVLARTLSERLHRVNADLSRAEASEKAYQRLLSEYYARPQVPLVGRTKAMTEVMARADQLAAGCEPVLIGGAPGTEKRSVAWRIHQASEKGAGPFIVFDPHQADLGEGRKTRSAMLSELAQDSVLFGCPPGLLPSMKSGRMGLLEAADGGTLVVENIDMLEPEVQEKLAVYLKTGTFLLLDGETHQSNARVIGLLSGDPGASRPVLSSASLSQALAQSSISVPTLSRRKKDFGLILDSLVELLSKRLGKSIAGVEQEAYQALLAYHWPGNVEELETVVTRAIKLTESDEIRMQDVFIGDDEQTGPTVDLLRLAPMKRLFLSRFFPSVFQLLTGLGLVGVLFFSATEFWSTGTELALIALWGFGEPLFLISTFAGARMACSCCPIGRVSSTLSLAGFRRDPPNWLRRYGTHLGALGLGVILWAEVATDMPHGRRPTTALLLSILVLAVAAGLLFKRRTWCRFLCPLGSWVGSLATCSTVELRGRTAVCNSDCVSHVCYLAAPGQPGCPMFEGPFSLRENTDCILCGDCIKVCPSNSPLVNLRLPGRELWNNRKLSSTLPVFVPVMIATLLLRLAGHASLLDRVKRLHASGWVLAGLTLALWAATLGVAAGLSRIGRQKDGEEATMRRSAANLLVGWTPLVVAGEIAYQLGALLGRGPDGLAILGRLVGLDQVARIFFLPWQVKAVELIVLSAGLGMTVLVEKLSSDRRLRVPGMVVALFLYFTFIWLVPLG